MSEAFTKAVARLRQAQAERLRHGERGVEKLHGATFTEWNNRFEALKAEEGAAGWELLAVALQEYSESSTRGLEEAREERRRMQEQAVVDRASTRSNERVMRLLTSAIMAAALAQAYAALHETFAKTAPPVVNVYPQIQSPAITVMPAPVTIMPTVAAPTSSPTPEGEERKQQHKATATGFGPGH